MARKGLVRNFTLAQFAIYTAALASSVAESNRSALAAASKIIVDEAKNEIGTYQEAIGPLPAWDELSAITKQDREAKGFSENEPLLRTGDLRDSISFEVGDDEAKIGSSDPKAVFHELGTETIPQRSFLAGSAYRKLDEVKEIVGSVTIGNITKGT